MSLLAAWLLGIALADLLRGERADHPPRRLRRHGAAATGAAVVLLLAATGQLVQGAAWLLPVLAAATIPLWVWLSARAVHDRRGQRPALGVLGITALVLVAASGWVAPVGGPLASWLSWTDAGILATTSATRLTLTGAVLLAQLATGNLVVRLVLAATGVIRAPGQAQPADHLRGGRLLGPMERLFIVGLGLAGELTAAGLVIAAKGLIRWPELQASSASGHRGAIDEITEYFLLGSFLSWLVALSGLALTALS